MMVFILKGGYTDVSEEGRDLLKFGSLRFRRAEHKHTVLVDKNKGCWSLLITGPKKRNWGFYTRSRTKMIRPLKYFSKFGHHQCD